MPCTEYRANQIAVAEKHGTAFQGPATIYLGLCSDPPTKSAAGTPVVYTGYAQVAYTVSDWDSDGIGNLVNHTAITFPTPTGGDDWAWYFEAWDAAGGNRVWFEELENPLHLTAALPAVEFPAGSLHFGVS